VADCLYEIFSLDTGVILFTMGIATSMPANAALRIHSKIPGNDFCVAERVAQPN
jgi:hypothetical protein